MTVRERTLLVLLGSTAAAAVVLFGAGAYFDRLAALDEEFTALQKRAVRLGQASPTEANIPAEAFQARFWTVGPLPEPLVFASTVQDALRNAGLRVTGSHGLPAESGSSWVAFQAEGDIEAWFRFLKDLKGRDDKALFRSLSLVRRAGARYTVEFEVGHAVLP